MLTTTYLEGETSRFTDSYGTIVQDTDHNGLFTFTGKQLTTMEVIEPLALAARSSASFPGAFEASFLPYEDASPAVGKAFQRPAMKEFSNATRPHWAVDGGLLANRPLQPLLEDDLRSTGRPGGPAGAALRSLSAGPLPSALASPPA